MDDHWRKDNKSRIQHKFVFNMSFINNSANNTEGKVSKQEKEECIKQRYRNKWDVKWIRMKNVKMKSVNTRDFRHIDNTKLFTSFGAKRHL